ncbi:MAG: PHP domain-containing protein [bacterium]|nr:PHP domain-containing protein [bacterium]
MALIDLHNHTYYSYDGRNSPEQIIQNAVSHGVEVIGITDHQFSIRERLPEYIAHLEYCRDKYKDEIRVLIGLEIGTRPAPNDLLADSCGRLDYVLFESLDDSLNRAMDLYEFLEWSRLFKCRRGLAHTDIFGLSEKYRIDMISIMRKYNLFWEINTSGNYSYYYDFLTSDKKRGLIKRSGLAVTVGSDTHDICEYRFKQLKRANELLEQLGNPLP